MKATAAIDAALDRMVLRMTSTLHREQVLLAATEGLLESLDAAAAHLWWTDDQSSTGTPSLKLAASAGLPPSTGHQPPPAFLKLLQSGDHLCTNNPPTDGSVGPPGWLLENGLRAMAALPLTHRDHTRGVLALYTRRALRQEEFERLYLFARQAAVALENARLYSEVEQLTDRLTAENAYLLGEVELEHNCGDIVGRSDAIRGVLEAIERVATTEASVLIEGETGTGKELVALAIHKRSRRSDRPMVKINCGAISAGLVESELFGHEKGAFTGAVDRRIGRFEVADGGTLFLDEVAELPADTQVKLLRALQEQEFERVGSSQPIRVDVRVIAAGNKDLAAEVRAGRFRADLYYRLNVFPIRVPPLRERREDVPLIAACILPTLAQRIGKPLEGIDPDSFERLAEYPWPGNVRELLNVLERAAILAPGPSVDIDEALLRGTVSTPASISKTSTPGGNGGASTSLLPLEDVERRHIITVLEHTGWQVEGKKGAAPILEMHPNTLRSRMKKLGIERPR